MSAYATIVADPPWHYDGFATMPGLARKAFERTVKIKPLPYGSMSVDEICAIPVDGIAASDSRLFLWATNRYLPDAFTVLATWGFIYKQTLVWRKSGNPSPFGGSVAPNHAEYLLVASAGNPRRLSRLKSSVIEAPAAAPGKSAPGGSRSHSAKPEMFLDLIEQVSPGPYLELFARRQRLGWDTWGDEAPNAIALQQTSVPPDRKGSQ